MILHIADGMLWRAAAVSGAYDCMVADAAPFIHCSTGRQVRTPWRTLFADTAGLVMLLIDERKVEATVRYEADRAPARCSSREQPTRRRRVAASRIHGRHPPRTARHGPRPPIPVPRRVLVHRHSSRCARDGVREFALFRAVRTRRRAGRL